MATLFITRNVYQFGQTIQSSISCISLQPVSPVAGGGKPSMQGYVEARGKVGGLFLPNGPQLSLHLASSLLLFIPLLDIFTQIYVWLQTSQNNSEHHLQDCNAAFFPPYLRGLCCCYCRHYHPQKCWVNLILRWYYVVLSFLCIYIKKKKLNSTSLID